MNKQDSTYLAQAKHQTAEYSHEGDKNLEIIDKAHRFTSWLYEQIKPHLKGDILEIGSGRGTYSQKIVADFPHSNIMLSDLDEAYATLLKKQFPADHVASFKLDLLEKDDFASIPAVDSAFALNVLEHVSDDVLALNHIYNHLKPGGKFIMLVPAHMALYNVIDSSIGHYRRYNKKMLREKVSQTPFHIKDLFYFNALAIPGWYVNGNILKKTILNENAVGLLNTLVPILRFGEKFIIRKKIGISLIAVLEKPIS